MPVAAFIVVVMGLLAAGMGIISSQTSIAGAQEQITVQSFYAAEAGAQFGMSAVFYDAASSLTRSSVAADCASISGSAINFTAPGMQGCSATISCSATIDSADTTTFIAIISIGRCGINPVNAERAVDVSAFLQ